MMNLAERLWAYVRFNIFTSVRIFEVMILAVCIVLLVRYFYPLKKQRHKHENLWTILLLVLIVMHVSLEGIRWAVFPLYATALLFILFYVYETVSGKLIFFHLPAERKSALRRIMRAILVFTMAVAVILAVSFPVFLMPAPNGRYHTGTMSFSVTDDNRFETFTQKVGVKREFMVHVWYPADLSNMSGIEFTPLLDNGDNVATLIARSINLPGFVLSQLKYVRTTSVRNAPLFPTGSKYPVMVISHGWKGLGALHTDLAEYFASRGWVVFAIDHTYGAIATSFPDKTVIPFAPQALPTNVSSDEYMKDAMFLVTTYEKDIRKTLDFIGDLNGTDLEVRFKGKLDLGQLVLIGHSTGGGASFQASALDPRIKILIGLDPWLEPVDKKVLEKGTQVPTLVLLSNRWFTGKNKQLIDTFTGISNQPTVIIGFPHAMHADFTLATRFSPFGFVFRGFRGSIAPDTMLNRLTRYIGGFISDALAGSMKKNFIPNLKKLHDREIRLLWASN